MSKRYELVEMEGRPVRVYESGLQIWDDTNRIKRPADGSVIRTAEKAKELHRRRQEKTARLIRSRLPAVSNSVLPNRVNTAAEAVAEAALMLWEQVVLNSDAYPRDRKEVFETVGRTAGLLRDPKDRTEPDGPNGPALSALTAGLNLETARTVERVLRDVLAVQSGRPTEPTVIDVTAEPTDRPTDGPTDGRTERDG